MADLVTPQQVLEQLRVDAGTDEDLIAGLTAAATRAVQAYTGRTIAAGPDEFGEDAPLAAMAVLLLVSTWYDNRDSIAPNNAPAEMPLTVTWLLWPLRRLAV